MRAQPEAFGRILTEHSQQNILGHERKAGESKRGREKRGTKDQEKHQGPREHIGKMTGLSRRKDKLKKGKPSSGSFSIGV